MHLHLTSAVRRGPAGCCWNAPNMPERPSCVHNSSTSSRGLQHPAPATPAPLPPLPLPLPLPRPAAQPVRPLVITSKARADAILSLTAAHVCGTGPHIAGLLLTDAAATIG